MGSSPYGNEMKENKLGSRSSSTSASSLEFTYKMEIKHPNPKYIQNLKTPKTKSAK